MKRRTFVSRTVAATLATRVLPGRLPLGSEEFRLEEATIADIRAAMESGLLTSEKLIDLYLARIAKYEDGGPRLNSILTLNPRAHDAARALDAERRSGRSR